MRKLFSCSSLDNLRKHYLRLSIDCANEYYSQHSKSSGIYETFLEAGAKFPSAQTPHLLRNHCPFRKAQRPPGQVSEIKQRERFAFENRSQIEAYFKHDICDGQKGVCKRQHLGVQKSCKAINIKPALGVLGQGLELAFLPTQGRPAAASKEGINWPMHISCFDLLPNGSLIIQTYRTESFFFSSVTLR